MIYNDNNVLLKIRALKPNLNPALKRIASYILENPDNIKNQKISMLAELCNVSQSTVTRFVRVMGYTGFQEFKISLAEMIPGEIDSEKKIEKGVYDDIVQNDTTESIISKIGLRNITALQDTLKILSPLEIDKAVSAIENAKILFFYCLGYAKISAENAKQRFYRVGKQSIIINDYAQQAVTASIFDKDNVAIGISNSGGTSLTVNSLKMAKENGATTICITSFDNSPICQYADIKLFTGTADSAFFNESMVSRICQLLVIDILYATFAAKHFNRSIEMIEKSTKAFKRTVSAKLK